MKKITLWLFALLTSWQMTAQVGIFQNYDSDTNMPAGWTVTGGGYVTATEACSGNSFVDNLYSFSTTGTLVTPNQVAGSNGTDLTVSFNYKIENWNSNTAASPGWGNIQVQYSTNNGGAWTTFFTIDDVNHVVANTCANFSNVIPAASVPNGSDVSIRFLFTWVAGDYDIYIDDFTATQVTALPPSCTVLATPTNGATNILSSTISWNNAPGIPTGYRLNVGTTPGGTNVLNLFDVGNVTSYNLGALNSGTTYYVTVIPYNTNGSATGCTESSFTTCGAITTYPSLETFATFLPTQCWSQGDGGDLTAGPATFGSSGWQADGLGNVGTSGAFKYNVFVASANDWVISPEFAIPATGYELKFDAAANQYGSTNAPSPAWEADDSIEVLVSTTGNTNWTVLHTYNDGNQPGNTATSLAIDLDAYASQTVKFAFRAVEGTADGGADIDFSIDNFQVRLTPTCPDQTGLTVSNITSSGADTSWDDMSVGGSVGYEYAVTTSATPPASGTATTALYFQPTGLTAQTVYYLHVRSECSGSTYGNWSTISFTTACSSITDFNENFDAVTTPALPTCWNKILSGATISNFATVGTVNFVSASAPNGVDLYNSNSSATDNIMLITPMLSNLSAGTHRLKFKARNNSATEDLEIGVLTDPSDAGTFTLVEAVDITGTFQSYVVNFDTFSGPGAVIAIRRLSTSMYTNVYLDDIVWEAMPTCPDQTGLTVSGITSSGANTSWDAVAAGVEYAVTTSATPPASGTPTTATFYIASGLAPQTVYYLHVRTDCGAGDYGIWVTIPFTTQCAPIASLPWIENFDAVTTPAIPQCWSEENGDYETAVAGTYNTAHSGTNYLRDAWSANNEFMWTPGFDLIAGTSYDFSSWIQGDGASSWTVDFFVNNVQNSTAATQLGPQYVVPGSGPIAIQPYAQATRSFVPATSGTYYFAFRVNESTGGPWYIAIDDVELKVSPSTPPACTTNLVATPNATCGNFSNNLTWNLEPTATGYYVTIGTSTGATDIANAVNVGSNSYSFTGSIGTTYFWKVVPYNAAGSATGCVEQSFSTVATGCYCASVPTSNDGTGITTAVVGATSNPIADVTYTDLTATPVIVEPGTTTNVQLTFNTGYDYDINIWVDFNNDFDFNDAGELVKTGIACTDVEPNTVDASFLMPLTAPTGVHRMRVGTADGGQVPPNECYSGSYGVTLDFTVDTTLGSNSFDTTTFVAYPNPVKDVLNLTYKTAISNVRVVNLLGQEVLNTKTNTNNVQVNMTALTAGAYIVNITVEDTVHTIKVIKE
ncbi:T9SS-dependent choice-of-anchor J family protein [Flavobacterium terrigena]|uniref:Por secretion system C-terminal sorting domain-containing protein n=1 Tax=Flavobacterium terrigena TaxID=402734 RepID=A0A1H6V4Z7_9FLAO|nr:choice-of-anchor J domain-containing protein [Flavobacterium terrigena]SEI95315.1 Por secretion system C-terminal sorting domain-containing protein [Flavobacterium terrigena]